MLMAAVVVAGVIFAAPSLRPGGGAALAAPTTLFFAVGAVCLAGIGGADRAERWRLRRRCAAELDRLRGLLYDLLPRRIADRMLSDSEKPPFERCRAAVLQVLPMFSFGLISDNIYSIYRINSTFFSVCLTIVPLTINV